MADQLKNILNDLDGGFAALLNDILSYEKKIKPKGILKVLEPSRTQTARAEVGATEIIHQAQNLNSDEYSDLVLSSGVLRNSLKAAAYGHALTKNQLSQYIWTKRKAVSDGIINLKNAINDNSLTLCMMQMRAILEQISDFVTFDKSIPSGPSRAESYTQNSEKITDISAILHSHIMATRIDWLDYTSKPMKGSKKKSYKPKEGFQSAEAKSILNSIDLLDKKVKGVRRGYEFLCEFAHPNVGTYMAYRASKKEISRNSPFMFIETVIRAEISKAGIEWLSSPIIGSFQLLAESLFEFEKSTASLNRLELSIKKYSIFATKKVLKNTARIWAKNEPCPCLSGKSVVSCCGKKLKIMKV
jgi:hypothetical protein